MIHLFRTEKHVIARTGSACYQLMLAWDDVFKSADPLGEIRSSIAIGQVQACDAPTHEEIRPPLVSQEVWGAGVTYFRSREARIDESKAHGGAGDHYARVYEATRPEIFFKATPHRVVGTGGKVRIRRDSSWNVPEPELALAINSRGKVIGCTVCNDMSSRDIEGQNPLYLPQAKTYDGCCALGPSLLLVEAPLSPQTAIEMTITRSAERCFHGSTTLSQMKRPFDELVAYCLRESSFPSGCYLTTGTGIVPPDTFTLEPGDTVAISIEPIGTLVNEVLRASD